MRNFISNALSPAKPSDTILIEEGDVRTAIVVVPDRQLSLAIGKEGQNARLAAKLTGWRIDIKSETEAATEGLSEIKRQQMQMMKQRSLEAKAAALPPSDDLLSRAEWLLRERDKSQATLETAARLLAHADQNRTELPQVGEREPDPQFDDEETEVAAAAPEAAEAVAPETPEAVAPEAAPEAEPVAVEPEVVAPEPETMVEAGEQFLTPETFVDEEFVDEDEEGGAAVDGKKAPAKKVKKDTKKRELVFDETLGQVVARRKRKPGRDGWGDTGEY